MFRGIENEAAFWNTNSCVKMKCNDDMNIAKTKVAANKSKLEVENRKLGMENLIYIFLLKPY